MNSDESIYAEHAVVVRGVLDPNARVLRAWRIGDSEVKHERLRLRAVVPDSDETWTRSKAVLTSPYRSFGVVEIEVRLSTCQKRALFVGNLVPAVDAELQEVVHQLAEVVVVPTDFAGDLTRTHGDPVPLLKAEAEWLGSPVRLYVEADGDAPADSTITTGAALWADQEMVTRAVKALIADKHRRSTDSEIAGMISLSGLKLRTIALGREGGYQFVYEDETNYGYRALVGGRQGEGPTGVSFKD